MYFFTFQINEVIKYLNILSLFLKFEQTFLLAPILPLMIGWTTAKEQGFLVGLASSGVGLANSVTYPIAGLLCKYSGWRSIFYFAGNFSIDVSF